MWELFPEMNIIPQQDEKILSNRIKYFPDFKIKRKHFPDSLVWDQEVRTRLWCVLSFVFRLSGREIPTFWEKPPKEEFPIPLPRGVPPWGGIPRDLWPRTAVSWGRPSAPESPPRPALCPAAHRTDRAPKSRSPCADVGCSRLCEQEAVLKATAVRSPLPAMSSILPCPPCLPHVMLSTPGVQGGSRGRGGLGAGGSSRGGVKRGGGRGHFIHLGIHCTTTWCFA